MADIRQELENLRRLKELEDKANGAGLPQPPSSTWGQNFSGRRASDELASALPAVPIAAGRTFDKAQAGMQQLNASLEAMKGAVTGGDPTGHLQTLANLEKTQRENDALYAPLKKAHPMATAVGENLLLGATPVGQATAVGRIMAPAAAGAALQGIQYGAPEERALKAAKGGAEGIAGGIGGEIMRRIVQPIPGVMGAQVQEAEKAAKAIPGVQLLPSNKTGSAELRGIEDMLGQSPGGRGPIAQRMQANSAAVTRHFLRGVGVDADSATPDVLSEASSKIKAEYSRLAPGVQLQVTQPVLDAVDRAEKALLKGAAEGKQGALSEIRRLKDQLYNTKAMSGEDWGAWQSDIGSIARSTENDKVGAILGELRKELNGYARGPAAAEWQANDRRNAMLETLLKPNVIIGDQVNPTAVNRVMKSQFGKTYMTGNLSGEAADVGRYGASVRNIREGSQTFGRGETDSLMGLAKAALKYPAAKALTSAGFSDYLTNGLLGTPAASRVGAGLLGNGAIPLSIAPIDLGLLGYLGGR